MRLPLTTLVLVLAAPAVAEQRDLSVYQNIIDRHPFGRVPPGFDATSNPNAPSVIRKDAVVEPEEQVVEPEVPLDERQEALLKIVRATGIWFNPITSSQTLAFSETVDPKQPAKTHLIELNGTEGGWTVTEIDPMKKTAKLKRDDIEIEVAVGETDAKGPATDGKRPVTTPEATRGSRSSLLRQGAPAQPDRDESTQTSPAAAPSGNSLLSRRRQREQAEEENRRNMEMRMKREQEAAIERQRQDFERKRAEDQKERDAERKARDAERQADREEYRQRLQSIADQVQMRMENEQNGEDSQE